MHNCDRKKEGMVLKHRMSMKTEAEIIAFSDIINH
jgi:hypothetical protein